MENIFLYCALSAVITFVIVSVIYWFFKNQLVLQMSILNDKLNESHTLLNQVENEKATSDYKCVELEKRVVQLKTELNSVSDRLQEELSNEAKQIQHFENIANKVLRTQLNVLGQEQHKGLKEILNPLKERINHFENKIEHSNKLSIDRHASLREQIHALHKQSEKVATDANNLAKALKGDFKAQGNWGEVVLQRILDKSGLEKNREYYLQQSERTGDGKLLKPDVVIHLPDNKRLVIDSKVSLVSYDAMVAAKKEEEQKVYQRAHATAIRNHVQILSSKSYHSLYNIQSPDFVMMFIPIDTAFSAALFADPNLYDDAFQKNIIIVTSSTLLATLKTVESLWRNDKQNRYAVKIAEEAGKLYDKFVGFVTDMEKMGLQLKTVQKTYDSSMKKLTEGSGNMIRKAELVKSLGAKTNKSISSKLVTKSLPEIAQSSRA